MTPIVLLRERAITRMRTTNERSSESSAEVSLPLPEAVATVVQPGLPAVPTPAAPAEQATHSNEPVAAPPTPPSAHSPSRSWRTWLLSAGIVIGVLPGGYVLVPPVSTALNTVSTDDAYVNGHVTFIAPRVAGHVTTVLADNNQRVKAGDLLAQLDKEPYQVQVDIKTSAVVGSEKRTVDREGPGKAAWPPRPAAAGSSSITRWKTCGIRSNC